MPETERAILAARRLVKSDDLEAVMAKLIKDQITILLSLPLEEKDRLQLARVYVDALDTVVGLVKALAEEQTETEKSDG